MPLPPLPLEVSADFSVIIGPKATDHPPWATAGKGSILEQDAEEGHVAVDMSGMSAQQMAVVQRNVRPHLCCDEA